MPTDSRPEFDYIDWLRRQQSPSSGVFIGPGDDCAMVENARQNFTLVTTDMLMDGTCFILAEAGPIRVGRKAMSVNLSDIAAMAGIPRYAVVSLALPRKDGRDLAEKLYQGMREIADAFEVAIVGGDTNTWAGPLVISVTLLGETTVLGPATRSGAKNNDWIFVTGELGGSILGKHLDFTPRVREAAWLLGNCRLHAMIDISDGFAADLHHICVESNCGAVIRSAAIPISQAARQQSIADGKSPLDHALGDGEDFELLFTVSPEDGKKLKSGRHADRITLYHVGEIIEQGVWLETDGRRQLLPRIGYVHEMDGA